MVLVRGFTTVRFLAANLVLSYGIPRIKHLSRLTIKVLNLAKGSKDIF